MRRYEVRSSGAYEGHRYMLDAPDGPWVLHDEVHELLERLEELSRENKRLLAENRELLDKLNPKVLKTMEEQDLADHSCFLPGNYETPLKNTCGGDGWYLCAECICHRYYKEGIRKQTDPEDEDA